MTRTFFRRLTLAVLLAPLSVCALEQKEPPRLPTAPVFQEIAPGRFVPVTPAAPLAPAIAPPPTPSGLFLEANPNSPMRPAIERARDVFNLLAGEVLRNDAFVPRHLQDLGNAQFPLPVEIPREIVAFSNRADADPRATKFVELLAKTQAQVVHTQRRRGFEGPFKDGFHPEFLSSPLPAGEYWDLATGPNGNYLMMGPLQAGLRYKLFDDSPYAVSVLKEMKRLLSDEGVPLANVDVERRDVRSLTPPAVPLAGIRAKNVTTYVPGFAENLDRMVDWIAPGGQLVLPTDIGQAHRFTILEELQPMILRLIEAGWSFDFFFAGDSGVTQDLDHIVMTRPGPGQVIDPKLARESWDRWKQAALGFRPKASRPAAGKSGGFDWKRLFGKLLGR